MDVTEPPHRTPRPGDPFATPTAADRPAPKKKPRKGRNFFLFLLLTGGVLAAASLVVFLNFKGMTVRFYADVVVPRGIPEALPPDYPEEDARTLVRTLHDFFAGAERGGATDDQVIAMISAIEAAMKDERITPEEAQDLLARARAAGAEG